MSPKLPFNRALLWIFLSTLLISGTSTIVWAYYVHVRQVRAQDSRYTIRVIVQRTSDLERLPTNYLAELLGLSVDKPQNLYRYNTKLAEQKLLASPLIQRAKVKKGLKNTIFIDYKVRRPIAYIGDFANTAVDVYGYQFPVAPFFTPKRLPTLILGAPEYSSHADPRHFALAKEVLQLFPEHSVSLVDVSEAYHKSFGRREIVAKLGEHTLRLGTKNFATAIKNYEALLEKKEELLASSVILDLRLDHLGYLMKLRPQSTHP